MLTLPKMPCTVEFRDEEIAVNLLKNRQVRYDGSIFEIFHIDKPYHRINHVSIDENNAMDSLLQLPPAQDSPKHILNLLNDNCLYELFRELDHLADFDSAARVCTQFNNVAKLVFPLKIRSRWMNLDDFVFDDGTQFKYISLAQIEHFLMNFGTSIQLLKNRQFYLEDEPNAMNSALKVNIFTVWISKWTENKMQFLMKFSLYFQN